jgi:hypothetical protein
MQDPQKRHITQVVKVVNDILEAQTVILQRIETGYTDHLAVYNELLTKIDLLDKKIEGGFTVMENNRLASLDHTISNKLKMLEYSYLKELKTKLNSVHMKLFQQIQTRMLQLLMKRPERPKKALEPERVSIKHPSYRPYASIAPTAVVPQAQSYDAAAIAEAAEELEGDWMESELEGATIFDSIITGWKRRDWEKIKGTKEMFMRGWKKLSASDKQKIKNGAWSKPIMNKIKMLGRELEP